MIACNTAHLFVPELERRLGCTFESLITASVSEVKVKKHTKVGLLASPTTIRTKLYEKELCKNGVDVVIPKQKDLEVIEDCIRKVISGNDAGKLKRQLLDVVDSLSEKGASSVVLGCTELSVIFAGNQDTRIIDPLDVITRKLLQ